MKVYVVTEGSYSDCRIEATYTDEAQASLHVERMLELSPGCDASVEEYEVVETAPEIVTYYHATLKAGEDAEVVESKCLGQPDYDFGRVHRGWQGIYSAWGNGRTADEARQRVKAALAAEQEKNRG